MSQPAVSSLPSPSNKVSGTRNIDLSSVLAENRSNKQPAEESQTLTANPTPQNLSSQLDSSLDDSQAVDPTPARMTRKRAAHLANLEDAALHKSRGEASRAGREDAGSPSSAGPISSICLCQPDPKIPRPRNAFILYRQRHQQNIIAQHPGLPNPEISKIAGELWRAEPDEVKNEWRLLAEEEKNRHAQQYPEYRFQPRHKNKTSATSVTGDKLRCSKCGGRSIASTGSPFPTPRKSALFTPAGYSPATPESTTISPRHLAGLNKLSISSPKSGATVAESMGSRYVGDAMEEMSADTKRRRYNEYYPNPPRQEHGRSLTAGLPSPNGYPYPLPQGFDTRRGSLPPPSGSPIHTPRNSIRRLSISSPVDGAQPVGVVMGPPPPPHAYPIARSVLHGYPLTPITAHPHRLPVANHSRQNSETLRLPPLRPPGPSDQRRSIEAMVKSIPYNRKLKLLRGVAPPLKEPSPTSPVNRTRGSIIAIEGDDSTSVNVVLQHLADSLNRSEEFEVRIMAGPNEPQGHVGSKDFFLEVAAWHDKSKEMIAFITDADTMPENFSTEQTRRPSRTLSVSSSRRGRLGDVDRMVIDHATELEEGEIDEQIKLCQNESQKILERKKEEMNQSIERESEKRRQSEQFERERRIPLVIIPRYILHTSDAWACALPIVDGYSPADHWQWVATLWRGIVGADHTVYVKSVDKEEPASAVSADNWPAGKPMVEMKEEFAGLVIVKEKETIEEGAMRRMAFEVGEWVRATAANASKGV